MNDRVGYFEKNFLLQNWGKCAKNRVYWQWRIQSVFNAGVPVWTPKLCTQINEKHLRKNLINSTLGIKSSLQQYLNIVRKLTLQYLCFFNKINQNCLHVIFQPVFTSNFELGFLCVLYIVTDFDVPKISSEQIDETASISPCWYKFTKI